MMRGYARAAGLPARMIIRVPVLSPRLSCALGRPRDARAGELARPLVESLKHEVVCSENDIEELRA